MSIWFYLAVAFGVGVLMFGVSVIVKYSKKRKLSREDRRKFQKFFKQISNKKSPKEKIIDYDKLFHKILNGFGYEGTFGEILKTYPNEIHDINKVWELHKLRNKLVHDFDLLDEKTLIKKSNEYKKELHKILK